MNTARRYCAFAAVTPVAALMPSTSTARGFGVSWLPTPAPGQARPALGYNECVAAVWGRQRQKRPGVATASRRLRLGLVHEHRPRRRSGQRCRWWVWHWRRVGQRRSRWGWRKCWKRRIRRGWRDGDGVSVLTRGPKESVRQRLRRAEVARVALDFVEAYSRIVMDLHMPRGHHSHVRRAHYVRELLGSDDSDVTGGRGRKGGAGIIRESVV